MSLRSTLLGCFTALTCVAAVLAYSNQFLRYSLVGNENGVFVLDRNTTLLHHCDKDSCKLITPQGTTIEMMRQMSGIPNPQDVLSQSTCGKCTTSIAAPKLSVTSFQSLTPESKPSSPDMIAKQQESIAKDVGMSVMAKPVSAVNPFPSDTNMSSASPSATSPSQPAATSGTPTDPMPSMSSPTLVSGPSSTGSAPDSSMMPPVSNISTPPAPVSPPPTVTPPAPISTDSSMGAQNPPATNPPATDPYSSNPPSMLPAQNVASFSGGDSNSGNSSQGI